MKRFGKAAQVSFYLFSVVLSGSVVLDIKFVSVTKCWDVCGMFGCTFMFFSHLYNGRQLLWLPVCFPQPQSFSEVRFACEVGDLPERADSSRCVHVLLSVSTTGGNFCGFLFAYLNHRAFPK